MQEAIQSPGFPVPVVMNVFNSNSTPYSCPQTHDCNNTTPGYVSFDIGRAPSLVPRLSPRTTTTIVKEGESLIPFRT